MPATDTFAFMRGEDVQIDWTQRVSEDPAAAAVDITAWTFDFKIKRQVADTGASLVTSSTSIVTAASGTFKTTIAAAQMALLSGDYRYALWRTNVGAEACLSEGFFSVTDTVRD